MNKSELRKSYLARQRSLSREQSSEMSSAIGRNFFQGLDLNGIAVLHSFLPIKKFNEVDTKIIVDRVWSNYPSIQVVVPRVDLGLNEITSVKYYAETETVRNVWGIDEPAVSEFVDDADIDLVLVPGVCFDRSGHRVGYGKGFYDRFLRRCRDDCRKVGLSHFDPVEKIDDVHDGDFALDAVVTPHRVIFF